MTENVLKNLATQVLETKQPDRSWIWKIIGIILVSISIWHLKRKLSLKSQELTRVRTDLELERLAAEHAKLTIQAKALNGAKELALAEAETRIQDIQRRQLELAHTEQETRSALETVHLVKEGDWDTLNRLAGVDP